MTSGRETRRPGWSPVLVALTGTVAIAAVAALLLARRARVIFPLYDIALLEIYARDALNGHLTVGPYSRFGWHHPGPFYFYILAPFYASSGEHTAGMNAGAFVVGIASVATLVWTAARLAGSVMSAAILASIAGYVWHVKYLIISAWTAHVIVLPTVALLTSCAALAAGDLVALPIIVVLASFIVQTDVALVPVVAVVVAVSAASGRSHAVRAGTGSWRPAVAASVALLMALWCLPAIEQIGHRPGNITALWRFFVSGGRAGQSWAAAAGAWTSMMPAMFRAELPLPSGGAFVQGSLTWPSVGAGLQVIGLVAVIVWATYRHRTEIAWLASLCLLASAVALWSMTRIEGRILDHLVFWISAIGALSVGITAGALGVCATRVARAVPAFTMPAIHALLIALCLYAGLRHLARASDGWLPATLVDAAAPRIAADVRAYLQRHGVRKPFFRVGDDQWGMAAGILLQLDRAGVAFSVEDSWLPMFPGRFAVTGREDAEMTIGGPELHAGMARRDQNVLVSATGRIYVDAVKIVPVAQR